MTNNNKSQELFFLTPSSPEPTQLEFSFDKFMKETLRQEAGKVKPQLNALPQKEETNPNKEYIKRYHEKVAGRMWVGKPRYR